MEKISDFFSELKERISNPFIISYLISWCIWNYKIVVGLLFYKITELKTDGYHSYLDLIRCNSSTWKFFWLPFISALTYTFIFPLFKNVILAFGAWIDTWGGNWNLKITKTQKVSSEIYLKYKIQYEEAIEKISKYANDEQDMLLKLEGAKNENSKIRDVLEKTKFDVNNQIKLLNNELNSNKNELENWKTINSVRALDGEWYLKTIKNNSSLFNISTPADIEEYNVLIGSGEITLQQKNGSSEKFYIKRVLCNFMYLVMTINERGDTGIAGGITWNLTLKDKDINILTGEDSGGLSLELRKKINVLPPHIEE